MSDFGGRLDQWLLSGDPANAGEPREYEGPMCGHCNEPLNEDVTTVDGADGKPYCSTYCATMVVRFEHSEGCRCDAFGLTLEGAWIK